MVGETSSAWAVSRLRVEEGEMGRCEASRKRAFFSSVLRANSVSTSITSSTEDSTLIGDGARGVTGTSKLYVDRAGESGLRF